MPTAGRLIASASAYSVHLAAGPEGAAKQMSAAREQIATRLREHLDTFGPELLDAYAERFADYLSLEGGSLRRDVEKVAVRNLEILIDNAIDDHPPLTADQEIEFHNSGARRAVQGVSLQSLLGAYNVWGSVAWTHVLGVVDREEGEDRAAALWFATRVLEHIAVVSSVVAQGYLEQSRHQWREDSRTATETVRSLVAGTLDLTTLDEHDVANLDLQDNYLLCLIDRYGEHAGLRAAVEDQRRVRRAVLDSVQRSAGTPLTGTTGQSTFVLLPVPDSHDIEGAHRDVDALAAQLTDHLVVTGGFHPGLVGIAVAFNEAKSTLDIAHQLSKPGTPTRFEDLVVEHILREHPLGAQLAARGYGPLVDYDATHSSELCATLEHYVDSKHNLTETARRSMVHANTVVYRLKRIGEITGLDPSTPKEMLELTLALRLGRTMSSTEDQRADNDM